LQEATITLYSNADEMQVHFDMPPDHTIDDANEKSIVIE
jgi:hypothetical protein